MEELLQGNWSWIVLGVLFLLMMRMHGGGHQHGTLERGPDEDRALRTGGSSAGMENTSIARDPVCGMEVKPASAAATTEYRGQTYHFCATGCKDAFEMNPEKFVQAQDTGHHRRMLSGG